MKLAFFTFLVLLGGSTEPAFACPAASSVNCSAENDGAYANDHGNCSQCQEDESGNYRMVSTACPRSLGCKGSYQRPSKKTKPSDDENE